ncbi:SEC-C domain-containing protein [Methylobacillus flagellatus]|uniref:YchJ family protein n=1 Tax=Methylobacillus flagellatus TaxID=405 RepID=UPI002853E6B5|nr:YchJ family metal-binding protein [Methylobacillus flagellatus]MDR5171709.1 SEC-C domain-containing protein [Methylobacillus flagellatus]
MKHAAPCPCESGAAYERCCRRWHEGEPAPDAEALMRSRYAAYVLGLKDYLLHTWHPSTRLASLQEEADAQPLKWLGLKVLRHEATGGDQANVEFVARYKVNGKAERLHESSRFVREHGQWFYVDGDFIGD